MGLFAAKKTMAVEEGHVSNVDNNDAGIEGLKVPEVTWYKRPGLRRLYLMMPVLFLGSQQPSGLLNDDMFSKQFQVLRPMATTDHYSMVFRLCIPGKLV